MTPTPRALVPTGFTEAQQPDLGRVEGWSHSPTSKADPDWLEAELSTVKSVPPLPPALQGRPLTGWGQTSQCSGSASCTWRKGWCCMSSEGGETDSGRGSLRGPFTGRSSGPRGHAFSGGSPPEAMQSMGPEALGFSLGDPSEATSARVAQSTRSGQASPHPQLPLALSTARPSLRHLCFAGGRP